MKKVILSVLLASLGVSFAAASYYGGHTQTVCTQDAYVCPNGTTVGRTGYNCQFVCPSTTITYSPSYTYTSGCYTYYYNGQTRTTSIVSYNCGTTYSYYPVATTYSYPTSQYYTYHYNSGRWSPSYTNQWTNTYYSNPYSNWNYGWTYGGYNTNTNYTNYGNYNTGYYNYGNYNNNSGCYYVNGQQVCQ